MSWPVQDAKARFSEMLDLAAAEGPQTVTRRGVEIAVLVPIEEWKRLNSRPSAGWIGFLTAPEPKLDLTGHIPKRRGRGVRLRAVDLG
jgi:prevent-host-death family protein